MSKYFGKCFGPPTRAPKFSTQMPKIFIIKISFTIKVNSVCGAGRDIRDLCHKFNPQIPALRILGITVTTPKSQGPSSRVLGVRVPCTSVPESQVQRSQVPGFRIPRSQVSGLDFRLCHPTVVILI